jgi:hypothetical protein
MKKILIGLVALVMVSCSTFESRQKLVEDKGYEIIRLAGGSQSNGVANQFICKDTYDNILFVKVNGEGSITDEVVILNLHKICGEVEEAGSEETEEEKDEWDWNNQ